MKKTIILLCSALLLLLSSCEKNSNTSKSSGYYVDVSKIPTASDFADINESIKNNELLYSLSYIRGNHEYDTYATADLFFTEDGWWWSCENHHGVYRFKPDNQQTTLWHIVNSNTIEKAYLDLARPSVEDATAYVKINVPKPLGNLVMAVYDDEIVSYTYARSENKIIVSDGTIFTVLDNGNLKQDGTSSTYTAYNPNESF